jgi:hypothetical protein
VRSGLPRTPTVIALGVLLLAATSSARAEVDHETDSPSRPIDWRLGAGVGGSWLPLDGGGIAMAVVRASVGFDYGRYSLRASPALQYGTVVEDSDRWEIALGYLALENVFRITPDYAMSISPLVGYGYSPDPTPGCTDVCSEPIGNGLTVGADASPATLLVGDDRAFELGVHAEIFVFTGGAVWPGAYLDFRWMFASVGDGDSGHQ